MLTYMASLIAILTATNPTTQSPSITHKDAVVAAQQARAFEVCVSAVPLAVAGCNELASHYQNPGRYLMDARVCRRAELKAMSQCFRQTETDGFENIRTSYDEFEEAADRFDACVERAKTGTETCLKINTPAMPLTPRTTAFACPLGNGRAPQLHR